MKLRGFVLTRDSWIWFWGQVVGAAGFALSGAVNVHALGLTDGQEHVLMGVCAAVLAFSARQASSALPGKADADKVTLPVKESV